MISIRVEPELLYLLERVSETPGTKYSGQNRTSLIETAIRQTYGIFQPEQA